MSDQTEIFKESELRPRLPLKKIISEERVREVMALMEAKKDKDAVAAMREIRYGLEAYEKRLKNKP